MRMKEDRPRNGRPNPGYNIQVGTENNFVIGYSVFPNPTDTRTLKPRLENVMRRPGCNFKFAIADAGYGSEENYDYLEEEGITGIIKYSNYETETKKTFNAENRRYDAERKEHACPCGNPVPYKRTEARKDGSAYERAYDICQCDNCEGCPFRRQCNEIRIRQDGSKKRAPA